MPDETRPRVLVLRCRACRTALPAASNDVAFRCPQCGRSWEIEGDELSERPSSYVLPPPGVREVIYLPYWSFALTANATPRTLDESTLRARDRATSLTRAFVSAYAIYRPTYVGEWGLVYTRAQPKWETRQGHGPQSPGAAITSSDAKAIAHHYILAEIDRAADLGLMDVSVDLGVPELWAIPCLDLGETIRCPWTRGELPAAALDDLSQIRPAAERREA